VNSPTQIALGTAAGQVTLGPKVGTAWTVHLFAERRMNGPQVKVRCGCNSRQGSVAYEDLAIKFENKQIVPETSGAQLDP